MMDLKNIGKLISESRKQAGYTQKQLADLLYVSDKAVSKWERGLSVPDQILLPKLSMILDVDIEHLIPNQIYENSSEWYGLLMLGSSIDISIVIYDKPLIHYLLSYYMLCGITNIVVDNINPQYIKSLKLKKYGLNIIENKNNILGKKVMIINEGILLFGANITRFFKSYMNQNNDVVVKTNKTELPIMFVHNYNGDINEKRKKAEIKSIGRGLINISLSNSKHVKDASKFVEIYQNNTGMKIADLEEIAINRNLM